MQFFSRKCLESGWVVFGINPSPIKAIMFVIGKYVTNHRGQYERMPETVLRRIYNEK